MWVNDIKMNLKDVGYEGIERTQLPQDSVLWWAAGKL
jgi:hypothetical protein